LSDHRLEELPMSRYSHRRLLATAAAGLALAGSLAPPSAEASSTAPARHVLLLSVDGMHASDLAYWVRTHPRSALARLVADGTDYTRAKTTFPSDSFPGMIAQFTGAGAGKAGVYYDDTYNRALDPAGTTNCRTAARGTEVPWTEALDRSQNPITLDAGQGLRAPALTALPKNSKAQTIAHRAAITRAILRMTPKPQAVINRAALPVNPATCRPIYPHDYLRVNTVFDVLHNHGMRTAWSDKHPAYEILNGPSGKGIDDLFTPEINSVADNAGDDWSTDNALTQVYDGTKVAAVLNEIDGRNHAGTRHVGTPAIFGMNFQTLSTAQKLPMSDGLKGGYTAAGLPGPLVRRALAFVNAELGAMVRHIARDGLSGSTTIILSAKHGQSPIRPQALRRVDDGAILDALNAAWAKTHKSAKPLVAFSVDDDGMLLWLSNRSASAFAFAKDYLMNHGAPANRINDPAGVYSTRVTHSGLTRVLTGAAADRFVGAARNDPHAPDLIGIARHGVVYTGKTAKIAEHGGNAADDRDVALVVSGAGVPHHKLDSTQVRTAQIAPTILALLGLNPRRLDAVRTLHTHVLPGI
jgi:hypothetical protein